jgi:hypothetical protein
MECKECGQPLHIADSKFESAEGSTDVYSVLTMVCVNSKCGLWCGVRKGEALSTASKIAETLRRKVN